MKTERRISTLVLFTGMAALVLALVALWFGLRRSPNAFAENVNQSEAQSPSGELIGAVAEPTTPSATEPVTVVITGELPPVIQVSLAPHLIDAENGSWLRDEQYKLIPRGTQDFGGIEFHLEGMIQLQGRASKDWKRRSYREQVRIPLTLTNLGDAGVESIQRGSNIGSVYLLGGTRYESEIEAVAANLVWRYTDGTSATTAIRYNFHVRDWIRYPFEQPAQLPYPFTKVVWTTPVAKQEERALRLYRFGLANPAPKKVIQQLDFVGMTGEATLFVVGLTLDPLPLGLRPDNSRDLEPVDSLPAYTLKLQVVNPDGEAVPTAAVTIRAHQKTDSPGWNITHSTKTDVTGALTLRYSLDKLESYEVASAHDDYAARKMVWNISAGDQIPPSYTLNLGEAVSIGGTVVDDTDQPTAEAKLRFGRFWTGGDDMNKKGEQEDFPSRSVTTDAQGFWQLKGLPPGLLDRIHVEVSHSDFIPANFTVGSNPADETKLRDRAHKLVLKRGVEVRVMVTDESDTPISGATVWAGGRYSSSRQEKKTDAQGRVTIRNLSAGEVKFSAVAKGRKPEEKSVAVGPAMPELVFKLARGSLVRGLVQNETGEPLPGARLVLESPSGGVAESYEFEMTTGADGRFEWDGAPDEPQNFYVYKAGYEQKRGQRLSPNQENIVTLRKGRKVQGWVVDADTEKPITKFRAGVGRSFVGGQFHADWPGLRDYSDLNGAFTIEVNEEQVDTVKAEADNYAEKVERLPAAQDGSVQVVLKLKPSASVRGVLVNQQGMPVAGATVALTHHGSGGPPFLQLRQGRLSTYDRDRKIVTTDGGGNFTLSSPPESGGTVVASADSGFASAPVEQVRASGRLVLRDFGRIEGTIKVGGSPKAGAEFTLSLETIGVFSEWDGHRKVSDEQGRFAFEKVPAGEVSVARLIKQGNNSWMHSHKTSVSVEPGQTGYVTFGETGAAINGSVRLETPAAEGEKIFFTGSLTSQRSARQMKHFGVTIGDDGSLSVDSIPPGSYTLNVTANKPGSQPWESKPVASGSVTVTVPENATSYNPIHVGEIILKPTPKP